MRTSKTTHFPVIKFCTHKMSIKFNQKSFPFSLHPKNNSQDDHKAFRRQLEDKRPIVESNLMSGRQFVASEPPLSDTSDSEGLSCLSCVFVSANLVLFNPQHLMLNRGSYRLKIKIANSRAAFDAKWQSWQNNGIIWLVAATTGSID